MKLKDIKLKLIAPWAKYCGKKKYYCSLCGNTSAHFINDGTKSKLFKNQQIIGGGFRKAVVCPYCGANDRIRWVDYSIDHFINLYSSEGSFGGKKRYVLHIAPEYKIEKKLKNNPSLSYISGDIRKNAADIVVDITDMKFENGSFDVIILNHVLEHIPDEAKAVSELLRCLKDDGRIMFSFPLALGKDTVEAGDEPTTPAQRKRLYGQAGHVRLHGENDVLERMRGYGLDAKCYIITDYLEPDRIKELNMMKDDRIFIGKKLS